MKPREPATGAEPSSAADVICTQTKGQQRDLPPESIDDPHSLLVMQFTE